MRLLPGFAAPLGTPAIISGFLTTGSIAGSILQVVLIVLDILLYLPFFAMVEKGFKKEELEN